MIILQNGIHAMMITLFVFVMMVLIDYINVLTKGKLSSLIKGNQFRQYSIVSLLGSTPGCLGAFLNVSFYIHGLISFGALVGGMIATSGDEAFIMLALFPQKAMLLIIILFVLGIVLAWLTDTIAKSLHLKTSRDCDLQQVHLDEECTCFNLEILKENYRKISLHRAFLLFLGSTFFILLVQGIIGPDQWNWKKMTMIVLLTAITGIIASVPEHFLQEHIWDHIIKKHIIRVFLWTFSAMVIVAIGLDAWNIEELITENYFWVLLFAVLLGLIPESGPHLIIVMLFAKGLLPFSILLASSIVQDGHGMLPLLSYSLRDSFYIKGFNIVYGFIIGLILLFLGL